jgi:hypothetical protein
VPIPSAGERLACWARRRRSGAATAIGSQSPPVLLVDSVRRRLPQAPAPLQVRRRRGPQKRLRSPREQLRRACLRPATPSQRVFPRCTDLHMAPYARWSGNGTGAICGFAQVCDHGSVGASRERERPASHTGTASNGRRAADIPADALARTAVRARRIGIEESAKERRMAREGSSPVSGLSGALPSRERFAPPRTLNATTKRDPTPPMARVGKAHSQGGSPRRLGG